MLSYFSFKSFDQQIKEAEMHLRRIEQRYGKESSMYRTRAKALELQKKNYNKIGRPKPVSEPLPDVEVCGG